MDVLRIAEQMRRSEWEFTPRTTPTVPILTRSDLQQNPPPFKGSYRSTSSGATGIPVVVEKVAESRLWWLASTIRIIEWFNLDVSRTMVFCKPDSKSILRFPKWHGELAKLYPKMGRAFEIPPRAECFEKIPDLDAEYLYTQPSLVGLVEQFMPDLLNVIVTGEVANFADPRFIEVYSASEVGTIAIECPDHDGTMHVMESIGLEILDENFRPAMAGQVVVTDFTSPYIRRYLIGDYAEWAVCPCGRALPAIKKGVVGRKRDLLHLPNGSKIWPVFGRSRFRSAAPTLERFQIRQNTTEQLTMYYQSPRPLSPVEQRALGGIIVTSLRNSFEVFFVHVGGFDLTTKFEEFVCDIKEVTP